jgi:hypothetical protein
LWTHEKGGAARKDISGGARFGFLPGFLLLGGRPTTKNTGGAAVSDTSAGAAERELARFLRLGGWSDETSFSISQTR